MADTFGSAVTDLQIDRDLSSLTLEDLEDIIYMLAKKDIIWCDVLYEGRIAVLFNSETQDAVKIQYPLFDFVPKEP